MDRKAVASIKKFILKLKKDFSVKRVILFGSRAGEDYLKNSDIDLIIVSDDFKGMDMRERIVKMYDYWDSNYDVDFLCYTGEEFNRLSNTATIAREALKKGIVIAS